MSKFLNRTGLLAIAKWLKKQLDSKLSVNKKAEDDLPYGYYSGEGNVKPASAIFNDHNGLQLSDYDDGSVDVVVDLTDQNIKGPLPVNKGGTGATDAATAAKNLNVLSLTGGLDLPFIVTNKIQDGTQLITSSDSAVGFADPSAMGTLYRRPFFKVAQYMQTKLAEATPTSKGFMSAADKAKLDGLGSGTKLTYTWDSSTRKIVVSGITPSEYKFYYRTSVGILKEIAPSGSTLTIPTDASSVIEVYCVNNSSNNKSLILI